jgi:hypothetical protein
MEVLQLLSMIVAPHEIADIGAHNYHFVTGEPDDGFDSCEANCLYRSQLLARGNTTGLDQTGQHTAAERERAERDARAAKARVRLGRRMDDLLRR